MKNKPTRHKELNTFKFQPFSERIANIDVDVFHRVGHKYETDEEDGETYMYQCLQKWNVLNLTDSFDNFRKELPRIQTLPLVLNQKEAIVATLLRYLDLKEPLSLQPVLEFVVALARDLRHEIYPFYQDILQRLIALLSTKDADQLEWTFTCLAYLFKFLWRYLIKDVNSVFDSLIPLLASSKPAYINNFAAESFAFVARKVKDKEAFISLILNTLQEKQKGVPGCGRLLFEVVRGVSGQFHSCAETVLPVYLMSLQNRTLPHQLLFEVLTHFVGAMTTGINPQKSKIFWTKAYEALQHFLLTWAADPSKDRENSICSFLKLVQQLVKYKSAVFVVDSGTAAKELVVNVLKKSNLPQSIKTLVVDIGACILLSSQIKLSQEHASLITLNILAVSNHDLMLEFTRKILPYSGFDTLVLPHLIEFCHSCIPPDTSCRTALRILTQLVLHKAPLCSSGLDVARWHKYSLNIGLAERMKTRNSLDVPALPSYIIDLLTVENIGELCQKFEDCTCALICLPHFVIDVKYDEVLGKFMHLIFTFLEHCSNSEEVGNVTEDSLEENNSLNVESLCFLLSIAMDSAVHVTSSENLENVVKLDFIVEKLLPFASKTKYISALRALDLYLTAYRINEKEESFRLPLLEKLFSALERNLSSPYHKVRLLTAHIFSLFENESEELLSSNSVLKGRLFSLCLASELVPPTVQDYREKLQHLQNLEFQATRTSLMGSTEFIKAPLRYLLGILYINFQLLWEPTSKLISSYAKGMMINEFWPVFIEQLKQAEILIRDPSATENLSEPCCHLPSDFLQSSDIFLNKMNDKPDHINYRILLWKTFAEFPELCEVKNKDVSPMFLSFVECEFFKSNEQDARTWNIKKRGIIVSQESENLDIGSSEDEDNDFENEAVVYNENENKSMIDNEIDNKAIDDSENGAAEHQLLKIVESSRKMTAQDFVRTLVAHMSVFAKLRNPKAIYREPELKKLYYDFLLHKNPEIQKMALNCLLTYKYNFMLPYQQNLRNLLDDKTFKTEITSFRIDKESSLIQEDHRKELIPVIMRIVYSKMLTKTGLRTAGKATAQLRRSLVLKFLAGCHEDELMEFLKMAFKIYASYMKDDPYDMVTEIRGSLDLEHILNPKQMQSSINLLRVVYDKFGSLMGERLLPYLMRVLLCIGAMATSALENRSVVYVGYLPVLKTLRTSCIGTAAHFFTQFDSYCWTSSEIDAVFDVFVWPSLERLPLEGVHSPTALLKLFMAWSNNSRYFVLFSKHRRGQPDVSPLPYIMKLLTGMKTHPSVSNAAMEIVENLLTLQDDQVQQEEDIEMTVDEVKVLPPLKVDCTLPVDEDAVSHLSLNYGSALLLPHVSSVLERLQRKLASSRSGLNHRDLGVLSRVSELVQSPASSDTLLQLLLPTLNKKSSASEEIVTQLIITVTNLIKNVEHPEKYLRLIAPLLRTVSAVPSRKLLCALLKLIAEKIASGDRDLFIANAQLIIEINAWDIKWIEQPDFNRRLDGFKKIQEMSDAGKIILDFGVLIIHNCFHILKFEKDISLRDSAGFCLRKLAPALCHKYSNINKDREFLISDTLLVILRNGIRDNTDVVQQESLALLGELARTCEELHPVLRDLSKICNKMDPEVDFFENMNHLQIHRKSRALLKFCEVSKSLTKAPQPRTLTHFILPCASMFLFNEKYSNKNSLIDAAILTVGTVCRLLPWHQYETVLRFYLTKMRSSVEYQKQLVRIIVAILDSFHFNLERAISSDKSNDSEAILSDTSGQILNISVSTRSECISESSDTKKKNENTTITKSSAWETPKAVMLDEASLPSQEEKQETPDDLDTLLDSCEDKPQEYESSPAEGSVLAIELVTKLPHSAALRVVHTIKTNLLPQLHRTIGQRTQTDSMHKLNRRQAGPDSDEEEVLRVPVALAAVKLLQKLPNELLKQNLPGILMKLCTFLKSRMDSVRRITRETLQKIMLTLGPHYLCTLLCEMSSLLTKGFHVHVLVYTIHSVLVALKDMFQPGDIDQCLQQILEICKLELFGAPSEEKDVAQIASRFFEARSTKSYDTFHILSQHITEKCFTDLLLPLKEVLMSTQSHKNVHKVSECLRHVVMGLSENKFVTLESILIFLYGVSSQTIPDLMPDEKKECLSDADKEKLSRQRVDTFIIPEAPRTRSGAITVKAKTSSHANAHVLVEFGLRLLYVLLKKEKVKTQYYYKFLDPMVVILKDCLKSQHVKRSAQALQCLSWMLRMNLPSIRIHLKELTALIFSILHKYAVAGLSKGDNFELVAAAFKAVTVLVREVENLVLEPEQLKALLLYAEKDIHDYQRQATAFGLLRGILNRRLNLPEVAEVMHKVAALSITAEHTHIRLQARQVLHQYIMNYPLGKKLEHHLSFFIAQLNYSVQSGRESALEMIQMLIISFPLETLEAHSTLLFIPIGAQLVNEESPECRKISANCLKSMLQKLGKSARNNLFDIVMIWLQEEKIKHRRLAAQLCGLFVQVEKLDFESRFPVILPILLQQFGCFFDTVDRPGKFVRITPAATDVNSENKLEQKEILRDHLLFHVLQTILKICEHCPGFLRNKEWKNDVESFAENAELLLAHEHEWVRLGAAQFLGFLFGCLDPEKVALSAANGNCHSSELSDFSGYIFTNTRQRLKSLILDFCAQLQPCELSNELIEQVIKNLVYLARVLKYIKEENKTGVTKFGDQNSNEECDTTAKLSLLWMIKKMRRIINTEIIHTPKCSVLRKSVFKWIGAVAIDLGRERLPLYLKHLLPPLVRELTSADESNAELRNLAKEVADIIKKKAGVEEYTRQFSILQTSLSVRRADRKKVRAQEAVSEPQKAAKRRIKKQLKRKDSKKKRIDYLKGRKRPKRKPSDVLFTDEII